MSVDRGGQFDVGFLADLREVAASLTETQSIDEPRPARPVAGMALPGVEGEEGAVIELPVVRLAVGPQIEEGAGTEHVFQRNPASRSRADDVDPVESDQPVDHH